MKRFFLLMSLVLLALSGNAKKVKVTIDGTVYRGQSELYLIVNEDIANAQLIPIENSRFSTTIEVEKNSFIRLHYYKEFPERSPFVLIPDSRHITINYETGEIIGSKLSQELKENMMFIKSLSPENFHIDVFSEDREAWAQAHKKAEQVRARMLASQRQAIIRIIMENPKAIFPAWIYYCYKDIINIPVEGLVEKGKKAKWIKHEILQL